MYNVNRRFIWTPNNIRDKIARQVRKWPSVQFENLMSTLAGAGVGYYVLV